jgi:GNAT superfamily N-acetyltransferase
MRIREATPADREFILSLSERFADFELPSWRNTEQVAGGTARRLDDALAAMNDRSTIVIVEDADGSPLGFAWLLIVEDFFSGRDIGKLSEIAVVRDGTGAGAVLMRETERWARERGCPLLVLNVMEHNEHARAFYERHGFAPEYTLMAKPL